MTERNPPRYTYPIENSVPSRMEISMDQPNSRLINTASMRIYGAGETIRNVKKAPSSPVFLSKYLYSRSGIV